MNLHCVARHWCIRICGHGVTVEDALCKVNWTQLKQSFSWVWWSPSIQLTRVVPPPPQPTELLWVCKCCTICTYVVLHLLFHWAPYVRLLTVQPCSQVVASFLDSLTWKHRHYGEGKKNLVSFLMWGRRNWKRAWIFRTKRQCLAHCSTKTFALFAVLMSQVPHMQLTPFLQNIFVSLMRRDEVSYSFKCPPHQYILCWKIRSCCHECCSIL